MNSSKAGRPLTTALLSGTTWLSREDSACHNGLRASLSVGCRYVEHLLNIWISCFLVSHHCCPASIPHDVSLALRSIHLALD